MTSPTKSASGRLSSASSSVSRCGADPLAGVREGEVECCSFSRGGVDPDSSAIAFNHALANCESNAGPAVFLVAMKPFEYTKDILLVLRIDPDAVILNREAPRRALIKSMNVNPRRFFGPVLEGVPDQILKHLLQMSLAHVYLRKRICCHDCIAFPNR